MSQGSTAAPVITTCNTCAACGSATSILITANVTAYAFENCAQLKTVTMTVSVKTFGIFAFKGCSAVTTFTIGSGVIFIGSNAFDGMSSLVDIVIPASVKTVQQSTFNNMNSIRTLTFADRTSDISLADGLWYQMTSLTTVTLGYGMTTIPYISFYGCTGLKVKL
jgi:hypothetical protein